MVRRLLAGVLLTCILAPGIFCGQKEERERSLIDEEVRLLLQDPRWYAACGSCELRESANGLWWEAVRSARERARAELARRLRVRITEAFVETTHGERTAQIERRIETYCDGLLEDVQLREYRGYPDGGQVTVAALIDAAAFREKVERKLREKRERLLTLLREGLAAADGGDPCGALSLWRDAETGLAEEFGDGGLCEDIDGNGSREEALGWLSARRRELAEGLELTTGGRKSFLGDGNRVQPQPVVIAYCRRNGRRVPAAGLYLKAGFVRGIGKISPQTPRTAADGSAALVVERVVPSKKTGDAVLHVSVDRERSSMPEGLPLARCAIALERRRVVTCAVSWQEKGIRPPQAEAVAQAVASTLAEEDFIVEQCEPEAAARTASRRGADYLLLMKLRVTVSRDRYDMAKALAEYDGEITAGSGRKVLARFEGKAQGYGPDAAAARKDLLRTLLPELSARQRHGFEQLRQER